MTGVMFILQAFCLYFFTYNLFMDASKIPWWTGLPTLMIAVYLTGLLVRMEATSQ